MVYEIEMRGNTLCIRKQDGTLEEIMDSVRFYIIANGYVYFECWHSLCLDAVGNGNSEGVNTNANTRVCELFSINNYISTGSVTLLNISQYRNNRPFDVDSYGIGNVSWNQIWNQEFHF